LGISVGFVGLGMMGLPMLENLCRSEPDRRGRERGACAMTAAARRGLAPQYWGRRGVARAAQRTGPRAGATFMKLGGLGMRLFGFDFFERDLPPGSEELAQAWRPFVETCIEAFGPARCMFESNFPVDKGCCSYAVLWNAFKRIAAGCSEHEKADLFAGTAIRFYRLPDELGRARP
jgi:hypothetical protein